MAKRTRGRPPNPFRTTTPARRRRLTEAQTAPVIIPTAAARPTTDHLRVVRQRHLTLGPEYRWQLVSADGTIRGMSQTGWVDRRACMRQTYRISLTVGSVPIWGPPFGATWSLTLVDLTEDCRALWEAPTQTQKKVARALARDAARSRTPGDSPEA